MGHSASDHQHIGLELGHVLTLAWSRRGDNPIAGGRTEDDGDGHDRVLNAR